eukprot:gene896-4159_t
MGDDDGFDEDTVRLGVVRESMKKNPLLVKPPLGKCKMQTHDPNMVYGIKSKKSDGGTAAALCYRLSTPLESEAAHRAKTRNPLITQADIGYARRPENDRVLEMVHGCKSHKGDSVNDSIKCWQETTSNARRREPEVGRAKPPMSASTLEKVHGMKAVRKDGGTAEVLSSWLQPETTARQPSKNPLLMKCDVGQAKHTMDESVLGKIHGKKSIDPSVEGGVSGALSCWNRPDTHEANQRYNKSCRLYKSELGRARPPIEPEAEEAVHGLKNPPHLAQPTATFVLVRVLLLTESCPTIYIIKCTIAALSNWNPSSPRGASRHHNRAPSGVCFGKASGQHEGVGNVINYSYGKQWLKEQLAKQTQKETLTADVETA